jgi:hypothetical protein
MVRMGLIHPGVPRKLALALAKSLGADVFVETGTLTGETAAWAGEHFNRVISIEIDKALHEQACTLTAGKGNVELLLGPSERLLPQIARSLSGPAVFWIDAHYSGPGTGGEEKQCPILEELAAISGANHLIMVDDARLFLNGPGMPCDSSHWPSLVAVLDALRAPHCYLAIHDDVIFRFPETLQRCFEQTVRPPPIKPAPPSLWRRLLSRLR